MLGLLGKRTCIILSWVRQESEFTSEMMALNFCPKCGSSDVFWISGLPQLWSLWECRKCDYRGSIILEDGELAIKLRDEWKKKDRTKGQKP